MCNNFQVYLVFVYYIFATFYYCLLSFSIHLNQPLRTSQYSLFFPTVPGVSYDIFLCTPYSHFCVRRLSIAPERVILLIRQLTFIVNFFRPADSQIRPTTFWRSNMQFKIPTGVLYRAFQKLCNLRCLHFFLKITTWSLLVEILLSWWCSYSGSSSGEDLFHYKASCKLNSVELLAQHRGPWQFLAITGFLMFSICAFITSNFTSSTSTSRTSISPSAHLVASNVRACI